jgi:predicted AAA+ superfamily ATPase
MLIERKPYIDKLMTYKDKPFIKVLTGTRRTGKSTILFQFQERLISEFVISIDQIQLFNFNDKRLVKKYD